MTGSSSPPDRDPSWGDVQTKRMIIVKAYLDGELVVTPSWFEHSDQRERPCQGVSLGRLCTAAREGAVFRDSFASSGGAVIEKADEQGWSGRGSVEIRWNGAGGSC